MPDCYLCRTNINDLLALGEMKTYKGFSAHYYCLLLSSTITHSGQNHEGILGFLPGDIIEEAERSVNRVCIYCYKFGASVQCCNDSCNNTFHLPCGIQNGSVHQFIGNFLSNCAKHRPKQHFPIPETIHICVICYDMINFENWAQVLRPPCCKQNYFHKPCVQKMALSACYYFKCPICYNKKLFRDTMKRFGVFIPDCNASWENNDAFRDLRFRHNECNAKICKCIGGRRFKELNNWDIVLCSFCGSQGTHTICSELQKCHIWTCDNCNINSETMNVPSTSIKSEHPETSTSNSKINTSVDIKIKIEIDSDDKEY